MILRAVFFIALAAMLMPHEPDLGLGRPGGSTSMLPAILPLLSGGAAAPQKACTDNPKACANMLAAADDFQGFALKRLKEVRAEIAADRKRRQADAN